MKHDRGRLVLWIALLMAAASGGALLTGASARMIGLGGPGSRAANVIRHEDDKHPTGRRGCRAPQPRSGGPVARCLRPHMLRLLVHHTTGRSYGGAIVKDEADESHPPMLSGRYRRLRGRGRPRTIKVSLGLTARASRLARPASIFDPVVVADDVNPLAGTSPPDGNFGAEASAAMDGDVILFASPSDKYSVNGGATFADLDRHIFPSWPGDLCFDQNVVYIPQVDRFVWINQYCNNGENENILRVAWASPRAIVNHAARAWTYITIDPTKLKGLGAHFSFDQPHIGVGPGPSGIPYLYMGVNVHRVITHRHLPDLTGPNYATMIRLNLADVNKPATTLWYYAASMWGLRPAQSIGHDAWYIGGTTDSNHKNVLRMYRWPAGANVIYGPYDNPFPPGGGNMTSLTPGGNDWLARTKCCTGYAVTGATISGGNLWAAWQNGVRTKDDCGNDLGYVQEPSIELARIDIRSGVPLLDEQCASSQLFTLTGDRQYAMAEPDLVTNARGEVAMSFVWGGARHYYANHGVAVLTNGSQFIADRIGDGEPPPFSDGDYTDVALADPYRNCFIAPGTTWYKNSAGGSTGAPGITIFGRRGDQCETPHFVEASSLTLNCPSRAPLTGAVQLSGRLSPARLTTVDIVYTFPDGTTYHVARPTDAQGFYSDSQVASPAGDWSVAVSWPGDPSTRTLGSTAGPCHVIVAPPPPGVVPTSLSLACHDGTGAGSVDGSLSPAMAGAEIDISYQPPAGATITHTVSTDSSGAFHDQFGDALGMVTAQASFPGNLAFAGSSSPSCSFNVAAPPPH